MGNHLKKIDELIDANANYKVNVPANDSTSEKEKMPFLAKMLIIFVLAFGVGYFSYIPIDFLQNNNIILKEKNDNTVISQDSIANYPSKQDSIYAKRGDILEFINGDKVHVGVGLLSDITIDDYKFIQSSFMDVSSSYMLYTEEVLVLTGNGSRYLFYETTHQNGTLITKMIKE